VPEAILEAQPDLQAEPGSCRRVLLVEDNPDGREMLRILLQAWGHRVEVAPDGLEGIRLALSWKPDAALLDIGLPGVDGYEVARQLRDTLGERIFLIALTAYGTAEDRRRAREAGFDVHMTKPADLTTLAALLRRGVSHSHG
jgi:two-component system, sensor histidine kinase